MKILFVTTNGIEDFASGAPKGSIRNYKLLKNYGEVEVRKISKRSTFYSLLSIVEGYFPPISSRDCHFIKHKLKKKEYDLVFFDLSFYGKLVRLVRKYGCPAIVFYHNCEADYIHVRFGKKKSIQKYIYLMIAKRCERLATKEASIRITFSERDAKRIKERYDIKVDYQIPLSILDMYQEKIIQEKSKKCVLFGPDTAPNIEGFDWFIKNVSPYLSCNTVVAGKGIEKYKNMWESEKVEVIGFIEDIVQFYTDAFCIAIPLFSGGGMKVKTVEALMFGKHIFGTDEAFSGFNMDYDSVGGLCNTSEEFIKRINKLFDTEDRYFNSKSRDIYEKQYSLQASEKIFQEIADKCGLTEKK